MNRYERNSSQLIGTKVALGPGAQLTKFIAAGMRRVGLGGALYRRAMGGLAAAEALRAGDLPLAVRGAVPDRNLGELLPPKDAE